MNHPWQLPSKGLAKGHAFYVLLQEDSIANTLNVIANDEPLVARLRAGDTVSGRGMGDYSRDSELLVERGKG